MKFELDEIQVEMLKTWQEKIKDLFGEYGNYTYSFTSCGIGTTVIVKSSLTKTELDISCQDRW